VIEQRWYRVRVIRDGRVIDWRDAPTPHADAYATVFRLLYPKDLVRADPISRHEDAYPRDRPYDPRD
jgi:hypothetical protein